MPLVFSIAVCDDEILVCQFLANKIQTILEEMQISCIVRQFYNAKELLKAEEQFDIIFLDIIMQELDGMQAAELFREKAFDKILIFVSSSREYVFDAYEVEAFWYLIKPINDEKLKKVLQRAICKIDNSPQEFMLVNSEGQKKKFFLEDIYYFEIQGRKIYAHGKTGVFSFYEKIGMLEQHLQGRSFFRCHKSYLVNLKYVKGYNRQELTMDNGETVFIAKRRYESFCKEILAYLKQWGGIL